jgi:hypothetical protein
MTQGELGEEYVLFLLEDQEEKPVAVVLPKNAVEQPLPEAQEVRPACCHLYLTERDMKSQAYMHAMETRRVCS